MAKVAEAHGAGTFCIGLEFTYAQKFDARWRQDHRGDPPGLSRQTHLRRELGQLRGGDLLGRARLHWRPGLFSPDEKRRPERSGNRGRLGQLKCAELVTYSKAHQDKKFLFVEIGYNDKRPRRGRAVGLQDGRRQCGRDPAALYRCGARSAAALPDHRRDVLVEMVSGNAEPGRGKLPDPNPGDQSVDCEALEGNAANGRHQLG